MADTIGIDIGGTKLLGVVLASDGSVMREARPASPHAGVDALVETAITLVGDLQDDGLAVGVGAAGLVDERGQLRYSPNLPLIRDADLRSALEAGLGRAVVVDN